MSHSIVSHPTAGVSWGVGVEELLEMPAAAVAAAAPSEYQL